LKKTLGWLTLATESANDFAKRHPRGLTTAVVLALGGFAVTAFGIAPMAPDAAQLPTRIVSETVVPTGIAAQLEALSEYGLELSRNDQTRSSDTVDSLLKRLGVADPAAAAFLRADSTARRLLEGRAGKIVQVRAQDNGALVELIARYPAENSEQFSTHFSRLSVTRDAGNWRATLETVPLSTQVRLGSGSIRSSLFAASDEAQIPDTVAIQMAEMFAVDIDFHRELRKGDTFSVVYEALTADGEAITWNQGAGRVLAAEFINNGRPHQAIWYHDANGRGAYFGFDGQSKRRAFLASPMEFSRVTSGFAMRFHPIHQTWRRHLGVDYGAPSGTPVRAIGDGVVDFAGWQNGYGNVVEIRHANQRSTLYAHLSRIDVKRGARVEQGARIGAVGATGWATGPHLHFEVRVKGEHQDPLKVAKASEAITIPASARAEFSALAATYKSQLETAHSRVAAATGPRD
jgi:murein DD-endopeptidase MepM/ murein hydrolase activator NlpD